MPGFVLHPEAYTDLDEIWEYIATDNLDAADRVLEEIYQTVRSLVAFPTKVTLVPTSLPSRYGFNQCGTM
jgi:plasmid stabilization system protein ParE